MGRGCTSRTHTLPAGQPALRGQPPSRPPLTHGHPAEQQQVPPDQGLLHRRRQPVARHPAHVLALRGGGLYSAVPAAGGGWERMYSGRLGVTYFERARNKNKLGPTATREMAFRSRLERSQGAAARTGRPAPPCPAPLPAGQPPAASRRLQAGAASRTPPALARSLGEPELGVWVVAPEDLGVADDPHGQQAAKGDERAEVVQRCNEAQHSCGTHEHLDI